MDEEKIRYKIEIDTKSANDAIEELFSELDPNVKEIGESAVGADSVDGLNESLKMILEKIEEWKAKQKEINEEIKKTSNELSDMRDRPTAQSFFNSEVDIHDAPDFEARYQKLGGLSAQYDGLTEDIETLNKAYDAIVHKQELMNATSEKSEGIFARLRETIRSCAESATKTSSSFANLGSRTSKSLTSMIRSFTRMGLAMLGARSAFYAFRKAVNEYLADNEAVSNKLSSIWSAIGNLIGPVVEWLVDKLVKLFSILSGLLKLLFGITLATGKATKATGAQAKAQEELNNQTAAFDEMNKLQDNKKTDTSGGGGAGGFSIPAKDLTNSKWAQRLKSIMDDIKATVENIKKAWKTAWEYNDNGKVIMETLSKIGDHIYDTMKGISSATREWSEKLNLIPLVTGIRNVIVELEPIIGKIGEAVVFIWKNGVLPIATWILESALPAFLNMIADGLDFIDAVLEAMKPILQYIWENVVSPLANTVGNIIVGILNDIGNAFKVCADWIRENSETAEALLIVVSSLIGVWVLYKSTMKLVEGACSLITFAMGHPMLTAIALLIAAIVFLINHWDEVKEMAVLAWEKIKEAWQKAGEWFNTKVIQPVKTFFSNLGSSVSTTMTNAWNKIKGVWSAFTGFFSGMFNNVRNWATTAGSIITNVFRNAYNSVTNAWRNFTTFFSNIWSGIGNIARSAVNGVIGVLNGMSFTVPSWVPVYGGSHFGFNIPYLAKGGIAVRPTGAIIGESGKEAVLPLENNTEWMDNLADKIADRIGGQPVVLQLDGKTIAKNQIKWQNKLGFSSNG